MGKPAAYRLISLFMFLFFLFLAVPSSGEDDPGSKQDKDAAATPLKPFKEVIKGTGQSRGLFNLYRTKDGKLYIEIKPQQLDFPFLFTINLSQGIGTHDIVTGSPLDNYIFEFHRVDGDVQFVERNSFFASDHDITQARAVREDFSQPILGSMKILAIDEANKSILVDATPLFSSDLSGLSTAVSQALKGSYSFDSSKSYLESSQAFPLNVEIQARENLNTETPPKDPFSLETIPDWRSIPLGVHYSLSSLPQNRYVPRLGDDRIGFYETGFKDFSSENPDSPVVRYINRWDMNKKPIVFWIENTTPKEYRDAIKAGILEWNKAFQNIGIPDAIEVKVQPDDADWKPGDIRYNVIYWVDSSESNFAGLGPSEVNPLTGEIYNASVIIDGEAIRRAKFIYRYEIGSNESNALSLQDRLLVSAGRHGAASRLCLLPPLKAREAELGALTIGLEPPGSGRFEAPESFINAYIKDTVMHEIGHCLGLRHNFHASTLLSLKEINNPEITQKKGLSASVMDYLPINLASAGKKQGDYFNPTIGAYDYWVISYGYSPSTAKTPEEEKEMLKKIASQSARKAYAYETDEDTYNPYSADPMAMTWDLSNDPLGFAVLRFNLYRNLWKQIDKKLPFQGDSFNESRKAFELVLNGYQAQIDIPVKYIGGEYFSRNHKGDPGATLPLFPVERSLQLKALNVLSKYVFDGNAFSFSHVFMEKLAPERHSDHFSGLQPYLTPFQYPAKEKISEMQKQALDDLFKPALLNRLLENEEAAPPASHPFTLTELFQWTTTHLFSELDNPNTWHISDLRRSLQHHYVENLIKLLVAPKPQMLIVPELEIPPIEIASVPQDARSLAQFHLNLLSKKIDSVLKHDGKKLDVLTAAHLETNLKLIKQALQARIEQTL